MELRLNVPLDAISGMLFPASPVVDKEMMRHVCVIFIAMVQRCDLPSLRGHCWLVTGTLSRW